MSYLTFAIADNQGALAQQQPLPAVTVDAPKPRVAPRATAARRSTASRTAARRPAAVTQQQEPVRYVTPSTGTIGAPPAPYAGGQVASGGRVGFLGNRSVFDTPFTQSNYTEQLIRNQQARDIVDVLDNNPAVRAVNSANVPQTNLFIRGMALSSRDFAFDGLYGLVSPFRPGIEGIDRIEVLNGPAAFLYGFPPSGSNGGVVNLVPKRATDHPITRLTGQYISDSIFGGTFDVGRRYGEAREFGMRVNGAFRGGDTTMDRNSEQFGNVSLGLDYRGERLRLSADFGYQYFDARAAPWGFSVAPGVVIPRAPDLTSNVRQPWERYTDENAFTVGRAEYDLTNGLTIFGAIGGSWNKKNELGTSNTRILNAAGNLLATPEVVPSVLEQWTAETGVRARFATGFIDHQTAVVYTRYESHARSGFFEGPTFNNNLYAPIVVPQPVLPLPGSLPRTTTDSQLEGVAVTDTMSAFDGRIQVIAGGRFQEAQRTNINAAGAITANYDKTAATPMAAVIVKPVQHMSLYASYAEGFGFGPTAPNNAINRGEIFPPIVTKQIETGAKLDLGTFGATLAFYEIERPSGFLNTVTNIYGMNGLQVNRGVDINVFGEPAPGLRVLGGVTLLDGRLAKTQGGTLDGKVAPGVPDVQVNIGGEVDLPPGVAAGVTLSGRVVYTSGQYYDQANLQFIPDWTRLDLGARYSFAVNGTPLVARFNVLNVAGTNYWASTGSGSLSLGTPRTFLLSISADLTPVPTAPIKTSMWTK